MTLLGLVMGLWRETSERRFAIAFFLKREMCSITELRCKTSGSPIGGGHFVRERCASASVTSKTDSPSTTPRRFLSNRQICMAFVSRLFSAFVSDCHRVRTLKNYLLIAFCFHNSHGRAYPLFSRNGG